ncbi:ornithine cyclodeaminase family protein [Arthrobacter sp. 4R501]|uniref:ornithine cyclodeaminase family protein n=1 Tax=Arthrobacter sp. 4R501 TaxID=2058886 RepID=UPI000CE32ACF|nr:ornithine cyclodeaminase [Arthrobacter sp. 4R501]
MQLNFIPQAEVRSLLGPAQATAAIMDALVTGLDPAADSARGIVPLTEGQFLIMPAEAAGYAGVKVATVAPNNPSQDLPRIQALYLIFDAQTLTPQAVLDGTALTTLRTPAVSIAGILPVLTQRSTPLRLAVFGAGQQGVGHVDTLTEVMEGRREIENVTYIVRNPDRVSLPPSAAGEVVALGSSAAAEAVAAADVIVCATSASEPLFDSSLVRTDVIVVAVGSHEPHVREVDAALCGRAQVIVEDVPTALRESGDVIMAIAEGTLTAEDLIPMKDVANGVVRLDPHRPVLFKSSGMSWEDLVIAKAVVQAYTKSNAVAR